MENLWKSLLDTVDQSVVEEKRALLFDEQDYDESKEDRKSLLGRVRLDNVVDHVVPRLGGGHIGGLREWLGRAQVFRKKGQWLWADRG